MSKKKFTDGLESLFSLSVEETENEEVLLVVEGEANQEQKAKSEKKKKKPAKRRHTKSFAADLEFLFSGSSAAPRETSKKIEADAADGAAASREATEKKKNDKEDDSPRVYSGLEALLRNTIDPAPYQQAEVSKVKRVTFTFDKEKLVRLKKIAKSQKSYLKDIIGKVVSEYIEQYEKDKQPAAGSE
ncbi:MAG: hypothetical protein AAFO94_10445 [Bacteroidota bacterium]